MPKPIKPNVHCLDGEIWGVSLTGGPDPGRAYVRCESEEEAAALSAYLQPKDGTEVVQVVFAGEDHPPGLTFVEVEDLACRGSRYGRWGRRRDGLRVLFLRLRLADREPATDAKAVIVDAVGRPVSLDLIDAAHRMAVEDGHAPDRVVINPVWLPDVGGLVSDPRNEQTIRTSVGVLRVELDETQTDLVDLGQTTRGKLGEAAWGAYYMVCARIVNAVAPEQPAPTQRAPMLTPSEVEALCAVLVDLKHGRGPVHFESAPSSTMDAATRALLRAVRSWGLPGSAFRCRSPRDSGSTFDPIPPSAYGVDRYEDIGSEYDPGAPQCRHCGGGLLRHVMPESL